MRLILAKLNKDLHTFDMDDKDIWIKKTSDSVDFEIVANLKYGGLPVYLESKMNPGSDAKEEIVIKLKNGDKITCNQFVHWFGSNGVFIEHANGSTSQFPVNNDKSTYAQQVVMCNEFSSEIQNDPNKTTFSASHTLETSIYLLEFMDLMKKNVTKSN